MSGSVANASSRLAAGAGSVLSRCRHGGRRARSRFTHHGVAATQFIQTANRGGVQLASAVSAAATPDSMRSAAQQEKGACSGAGHAGSCGQTRARSANQG